MTFVLYRRSNRNKNTCTLWAYSWKGDRHLPILLILASHWSILSSYSPLIGQLNTLTTRLSLVNTLNSLFSLVRPGEIHLAALFSVCTAGWTMLGPMTTWPPSSMRWHHIGWECDHWHVTQGYYLVSVDQPGHGLTSKYPAGMQYKMSDGFVFLR